LLSVAAFVFTAAMLDPELRPSRPGRTLSSADKDGVLAALIEYQRVYQDLFASGGRPDQLDAFPASRDVKHHVFRDLGFVASAGLVHVQDLASASVMEAVRTGRDSAEALVYEEWNYVFEKASDRKPASKLKGMGQGFRYRLRLVDGRWIVVGWEAEDVEAPGREEGRKW
jgi:hypothetical protein